MAGKELGGEDHLVCLRRSVAVERDLGEGPARVAIPRARPCEPDEVQLLSGEAVEAVEETSREGHGVCLEGGVDHP